MNIFKDYSFQQLIAVEETLQNFYYGPDLKKKNVRRLYTGVMKEVKKQLKKAFKKKKQ